MPSELEARTRTGRITIERVEPSIDCGRYRAKAIVGDDFVLSADIFRDGPDLLQAVVRFKGPDDRRWSEAPMTHVDNDRWAGSFSPDRIGRWRYTIEAWTDRFGTWRRDLAKKAEAGQDVALDLEEGALLVDATMLSLKGRDRKTATRAAATMRGDDRAAAIAAALDEGLARTMAAHSDRRDSTVAQPAWELTVDRERARFGAWYELFPRSTGSAGRHGTFETAAKELSRVADMGFDVVYFPPIHPIGTTNRKGKNNSLQAGADDVGVPWAIGSSEGGHKAVHPELGTLEDFDALVATAADLGLEIALDFAIQCSPDHPWVAEHPEWFAHRPDGTIKFAENPPKKYQDIYPIDFDTPDKEGLWNELKSVTDFWISHGVKVFRVDNPHTKAFAFWEWLIESTQREHPDVIFLSEAFTRPKVMKALAKLGFTQSYTYFTWRNHKAELIEYLHELVHSEMAHYFRPNFFTNTPDILHEYLQTGGPPAFKIRLVLAAFLSPTYGIYSGYELFENVPLRKGSEEYLNSEKYELRPRDWYGQDNLMSYIARVNEIRRAHPALARLTNLRFHDADKDHVLAFSKTAEGHDPILVVVNLNPFHWEEATVRLDLGALGIDDGRPFEVHDLVSGATYVWRGPHNYVRLDPLVDPAHVFRVAPRDM